MLVKQRKQDGNRKTSGTRFLHSHTSSTGICWKCNPLPYLWPLRLSYPPHPVSSLHLCLLNHFLDPKTRFISLSLLSHPTPVWAISSSVLIVSCTSSFNGTPAAFFCLPKTTEAFLLPLQNIKGIIEWALNIHISNGPSLLPSIKLLFAEVCDLNEIFVGGGFLSLHDITVNDFV